MEEIRRKRDTFIHNKTEKCTSTYHKCFKCRLNIISTYCKAAVEHRSIGSFIDYTICARKLGQHSFSFSRYLTNHKVGVKTPWTRASKQAHLKIYTLHFTNRHWQSFDVNTAI